MSWDGKERRHGATRRLYIVFVLACAYMTLVLAVGEVRNRDWADDRARDRAQVTYQNAIDSCERGLDIRRESNDRIPQHTTDAKNLRDLASALAHTRQLEADFYRGFGERAGIEQQLAPLVRALETAARKDRAVERSQERVTFGALSERPCTQVVKRP